MNHVCVLLCGQELLSNSGHGSTDNVQRLPVVSDESQRGSVICYGICLESNSEQMTQPHHSFYLIRQHSFPRYDQHLSLCAEMCDIQGLQLLAAQGERRKRSEERLRTLSRTDSSSEVALQVQRLTRVSGGTKLVTETAEDRDNAL